MELKISQFRNSKMYLMIVSWSSIHVPCVNIPWIRERRFRACFFTCSFILSSPIECEYGEHCYKVGIPCVWTEIIVGTHLWRLFHSVHFYKLNDHVSFKLLLRFHSTIISNTDAIVWVGLSIAQCLIYCYMYSCTHCSVDVEHFSRSLRS